MVRQRLDVDGHWNIIIYYGLDSRYYNIIVKDLYKIKCTNKTIKEIYTVCVGKLNTGFTITNDFYKTTIVGINYTSSVRELISTIVHEGEHIMSHICKYYKVDTNSEQAAYLLQYIIANMYDVFKQWL